MKKIMNMTLSQKRKLSAATMLPLAAMILMVSFQNCSPGVVQSTKLDSVSTGGNGTLNLDEDTKPVTVAYSENVLTSMQLQTGLQTVSTRTLNSNTNAKAKISETGKADTVNAPMWISITNLAGEVCLDLVTEERARPAASRRFFNQVDFARSPASLTSEARLDLIRRMARNFWGRNETAVERTVLLSSLSDAEAQPRRPGANDAAETEDFMIYSCTAMLSSLDAIRF